MNGGRLKQLRLARGFSLEQLAAQMGGLVTKQALSKYEGSRAVPSPRVLTKLAQVFGIKAAHLLEEPVVQVERIAYRRRSRLGKREECRIENISRLALEERVRLQFIWLGDTRTTLPIQERNIRRLEDAEDAACQLRKDWNLGTSPIADVTATLEDHQIHVIMLSASETFDGLSLVAKENDSPVAAAVVCRERLTGERQRLNLAHELGHLVLKVADNLDEEKVAFRFAGAFLAPRDSLIREVGERRRSIGFPELLLLKRRFGMSAQALLRRLLDLEVISDAHYRGWCIEINRLGYRKQEPGEWEAEEPLWLRRTVHSALSEGFIDKQSAEKLLGEKVEIPESTSLAERRALLRLPVEERRRRMMMQMEKLAKVYEEDEEWKEFQGGDIVEYEP